MTNQSKVAPVEAQAVPQPKRQLILSYLAKWENENGTLCAITPDEWMALMEPVANLAVLESPQQALNLFTRPTPAAAADLFPIIFAVARIACGKQNQAGMHHVQRLAEAFGDTEQGRLLRDMLATCPAPDAPPPARVVAASPAAAAGVPTGAIAATLKMASDALHECRRTIGNINGGGDWAYIQADNAETAIEKLLDALASPVAPVGAPTRQHSVHLAADDVDQDFRRRPASSEAAPKQPDSDSVHPAMSTSSVPTAAPLLSLSESGCSELPLRADVENGFILDERGEIVCQFWNKCEDDFAKKAENMRCIVNAMNSHDELVTALREIAEHGNAWTHEGLVMIARDALETRK